MAAIFSPPFRVQRKALVAGALTEIIAPITCSSCTVANRTGGDLRLITDGSGAVDYGIITDSFEERINLSQSGSATAYFRKDQIGFHLKADNTGVVILSWS